MQHEYLVMALQAAAKRHRVLKNGSNSDYSMDVKPSLKHTPSKPALGVLRGCYREAFSLFSRVRFELKNSTTISVGRKPERFQCVVIVTSRQ